MVSYADPAPAMSTVHRSDQDDAFRKPWTLHDAYTCHEVILIDVVVIATYAARTYDPED
jgi:hypothetical protein